MTQLDLIRLLAAWALVHETADEGWKAAVARGEAGSPGSGGPGAFVDGLAALVDAEKERLKASLAAPGGAGPTAEGPGGEAMERLLFELSEIRGRLEAMESALDAIRTRLPEVPGRGSATP